MSGHVFNIPRVGDGGCAGLNQSSRRSDVAPHGCCICDKRAALRSLRLRPIAEVKFARRLRDALNIVAHDVHRKWLSVVPGGSLSQRSKLPSILLALSTT